MNNLNPEQKRESMQKIKFNYWAILIFLFLFILVLRTTTYAQQVDQQAEGRFSKKAEAQFHIYEMNIKAEIEKLNNPEWEGEYSLGNGLGIDGHLFFAKESGFTYIEAGCIGVVDDRNYGSIEIDGNLLRLQLTFESKQRRIGLAKEYYKVLWGERHYLIPPGRIIEFCNAINAGFEPTMNIFRRSFLLKAGDIRKPVQNKPNIPIEFKDYLLPKQINAKIVKIFDSKTKDENSIAKRYSHILINIGKNKGMLVGMELHIVGKHRYGTATITLVNKNTSEAELDQNGIDAKSKPIVNGHLSTKLTHFKF